MDQKKVRRSARFQIKLLQKKKHFEADTQFSNCSITQMHLKKEIGEDEIE